MKAVGAAEAQKTVHEAQERFARGLMEFRLAERLLNTPEIMRHLHRALSAELGAMLALVREEDLGRDVDLGARAAHDRRRGALRGARDVDEHEMVVIDGRRRPELIAGCGDRDALREVCQLRAERVRSHNRQHRHAAGDAAHEERPVGHEVDVTG
jgi:hypothetical protein